MNISFDKLLDNAFSKKNITLNIVESQNMKSLEVRGENNATIEPNDNFIAPDNFDIRLHESLRIMSDWIDLTENKNLTHKDESSLEI